MKNTLGDIGVNMEIQELKRLGKFTTLRMKPREQLLKPSTEYQARLIIARAQENGKGCYEYKVLILLIHKRIPQEILNSTMKELV